MTRCYYRELKKVIKIEVCIYEPNVHIKIEVYKNTKL